MVGHAGVGKAEGGQPGGLVQPLKLAHSNIIQPDDVSLAVLGVGQCPFVAHQINMRPLGFQDFTDAGHGR